MNQNRKKKISIVVPAFNEEAVLPEFQKRIQTVVNELPYDTEIIYINDGSTDKTLEILTGICKEDLTVKVLDLSRNYGKEIALTAGLDYCSADAAIPIDADLQDPPEVIPRLIEKWEEGFNVVYARRTSREGESWLKKATAKSFYKFMQRLGRVSIPENVGDFRLIDRKALNALKELREHHRFMKGLFTLIGFRQIAIDYSRDARFAGETKWNYWKLWNFSLEGITSFSIAPLKLSTYLGLMTAFAAFSYGIFVFGKALFLGDDVPGYPSLMVVIAFLGGIQLVVLGIIGEYLGRVFNETKNRPLYFIQDVIGEPSDKDV
ncbi:MAG: glycosyltransferase family 2 protein [Sneathiellales bacterium]|nr:glycosyltransferase family 2 protein [Sneathiellales bacterium]